MESGFMNRFRIPKLSKKDIRFINFYWPLMVLCLTYLMSCTSDKSVQGFNEEDGFNPNDRGVVSKTLINTLAIEESFTDTLVATEALSNTSSKLET